jgi:hypothetical protein
VKPIDFRPSFSGRDPRACGDRRPVFSQPPKG